MLLRFFIGSFFFALGLNVLVNGDAFSGYIQAKNVEYNLGAPTVHRMGIFPRSKQLGTTIRQPEEVIDHHMECLRRHNAFVVYGPPLTSEKGLDKATFILATFRPTEEHNLKECGSDANVIPPGLRNDNTRCILTRGHLLAKSLGGDGNCTLNMVALCQSANGDVMEEWESTIAKVRKNVLVANRSIAEIHYRVEAVYCKRRTSPAALWLQALIKKTEEDNFQEWLRILIPNEEDVKAFIYVDKSAALGLGFTNLGDRDNVFVRNVALINEELTSERRKNLRYPHQLVSRKKQERDNPRAYSASHKKFKRENSICSWKMPNRKNMEEEH